jgi:outer membrane protein assembly factor BamB
VILLDEQLLALLDRDLNEEVWSRSSGEQWSSFQPLVWQETVIVGDPEGNVYAFRLADGSTAWTTRVEGKVRGLGASGAGTDSSDQVETHDRDADR